MSSQLQNSRGRVAVASFALAAVLCSFAGLAAGQNQPAPAWELFGGYSFFYPGADVHGLLPLGVLPVSSRLESNPRGIGASVTYNFNRWLGLTGDLSGHWGSGESGLAGRIDDAAFYNLSLGPKITFRGSHFSPFLEALVGDHRLAPDAFHKIDKLGFMAGGGLDVNLSRHFALRLLRGDYVMSSYRYGPSSSTPSTDLRGIRLQSGVVLMFGGEEAGPPVSASCVVNPAEVMVGEPAMATASGSNFNSRHTLNYAWSSTGGEVSGKDSTATINTNGMSGGTYRVTAHISDSRVRKNADASCAATFLVKEPPKNPPLISCSANPSTVQPGTNSTISCICTSPDNVPVVVGGWSASGGSVAVSGSNTGSLSTSSVGPGPITVNARCSDTRGLNTPATAEVQVENPAPSPEFLQLEHRLALHSIYFQTARPRVTKPDGGLLPSQQKTLISLAEDFKKYLETKPDAHLTLEGHADPRASVEYNQALSERRVERTRSFLLERGVPAANVETKAFGKQRNLTDAQVRDAVEHNPELTADERQRILDNLQTVALASNRRVDVTLSTTGQKSVREYPFNAADSLALLQQEGPKKTARPAARKRAKHPARQ